MKFSPRIFSSLNSISFLVFFSFVNLNCFWIEIVLQFQIQHPTLIFASFKLASILPFISRLVPVLLRKYQLWRHSRNTQAYVQKDRSRKTGEHHVTCGPSTSPGNRSRKHSAAVLLLLIIPGPLALQPHDQNLLLLRSFRKLYKYTTLVLIRIRTNHACLDFFCV